MPPWSSPAGVHSKTGKDFVPHPDEALTNLGKIA